MRPLIGITAGEIHNQAEPWAPTAHGQSSTYIQAIIQAGGVPFVLPVTDDAEVLGRLYGIIDGLFLTGGNDINPNLYEQAAYPETNDFSDLRDRTEAQLATWALAAAKPILGVCRGMQLVNILRGGSLYQHIPADIPGALDHNSSTKKQDLEDIEHTLRIDPASRLAAAIGPEPIGANAHHHQAIHVVGQGLQAVAWASDGVIEAIELVNYPYMIGVQPHPESLAPRAETRWRRLFSSFVEASAKTPRPTTLRGL